MVSTMPRLLRAVISFGLGLGVGLAPGMVIARLFQTESRLSLALLLSVDVVWHQ
jgi:hypothetical protein